MHTPRSLLLVLLVLLRPQTPLYGVMGAAINMDELMNDTEPPAPEQKDFNSCYESELDATLSTQRLEVLRQEILSKLNLEQEPESPPQEVEVSADLWASYQAAVALDGVIEEEREAREERQGCAEKETFYAKEVMLYFPYRFTGEDPPINIFEWGPLLNDKLIRRSVDDKDSKDFFTKETKPQGSGELAPSKIYPQQHYSEPIPLDTYTIEAPSLSQYVTPIKYSLTFADVSIPSHKPLWSANLRLYKRKVISDNSLLKRDSNPTENIEIYFITNEVGVDGKPLRHPVLVTSQDIRTEDDEYVSFDLTSGMQDWLQATDQPSQLVMEVVIRCPESVSTGLKFLPSVTFDVPFPGSKDINNAQLVLKVLAEKKTESGKKKRQLERGVSSEYCLSNPNETNCCLRELTINFKQDLGWNWIIAPSSIKTNYCQGLCPAIWPSATMSTTFLHSLRRTNPKSSPEPCCAPRTLKPLTILVITNGRLSLQRLQDVIVTACDCR